MIKLNISPKILNSVASLYTDTNRIFMEFIDNSIDSAEDFYDRISESYNKKIEILVIIDKKKKQISFLDNCTGIDNLSRVIKTIGDSEKKASTFTNGQFGFGIFSSFASNESFRISTKHASCLKGKAISISRRDFDVSNLNDLNLEDPYDIDFPNDTGTRIDLLKFDGERWRDVDIGDIKNNIESHFGFLLTRKNLKISILDSNKSVSYDCEPFDYESLEGEELNLLEGEFKHNDLTIKLEEENKVHFYIKATKGINIEKPPIIISKGRRIGNICDLKSFKSNNKQAIWKHPSVTGFIDVKNFLEPNISRTDFKNNTNLKSFYKKLINIEELIQEDINKANKNSEDKGFKKIADEFNKVLSNLAKQDNLMFNEQFNRGGDANLKPGDADKAFSDLGGQWHREGEPNPFPKPPDPGPHPGPHPGPNPEPVDTPNEENIGGSLSNQSGNSKDVSSLIEEDNPYADSDFKGKRKKSFGLNIEFVDGPPLEDQSGELIRSQEISGTVRIWKEHPEFQKRLSYKRAGNKPKVTQRLLTFITGEVTVHYKDMQHTKNRQQPDYNKAMFENLVQFIYKVEDALQNLVGSEIDSDIQ